MSMPDLKSPLWVNVTTRIGEVITGLAESVTIMGDDYIRLTPKDAIFPRCIPLTDIASIVECDRNGEAKNVDA